MTIKEKKDNFIKKYKQLKGNTKKFLKKYNGDICTLLGLMFINTSIYLFNVKIGLFVTGSILVLIGYLFNSSK